jgi:hypothetical protein
MGKFVVHIHEWKNLEGKIVVLLELELANKKEIFSIDDMIGFASQLGLDISLFDDIYNGCNISFFVSNANFDLSLFYVDLTNTISMSIICKLPSSLNKLRSLLNKMKMLKEGEYLEYIEEK